MNLYIEKVLWFLKCWTVLRICRISKRPENWLLPLSLVQEELQDLLSRVFEFSVSLPPEDCFINLASDTLPSGTTESVLSIYSSTSQSQTEDPILIPPPCTPPHPAKRGRGRGRPPLSSQTEDPILTPPPCSPTSSSQQRKRKTCSKFTFTTTC
jgi:hypothetical protein